MFYREFFCRLKEEPFAVLFADLASRPNIPVNVLIGLDALKAGFGWSDEELYDHFVFDVQVRFALGYRDLKEGEFDLRTLYNFRRRLSQYNQAHGTNLLSAAFADITDQQITAFKVHTGKQRMDSTQIASHILDASRLELAVEAVQRLQRLMKASDQQHFTELLAPFSKGDAGQYVYRIKGKEATAEHLQAVGQVLWQLLQELAAENAHDPVYQVVQRFFDENYRVLESQVQTKEPKELGSGSLQSLDDLEATYRQYKGYVANLTETCDPDNPLQLITAVQVAPNNCEDADLLVEVLPELKERTDLETLYADGGYGSPAADEALSQTSVELHQTGIRGKDPNPKKLNLSDLTFELDENGQPFLISCPGQQTGTVTSGTKGYTTYFEAAICRACPFLADQRCRARRVKQDKSHFNWAFTPKEFLWSQRRKRYLQLKQQPHNPRTAVEATVRSVKHPFPGSRLPVRGRFRVTCVIVASAAMTNIRRIRRYLVNKEQKKAADEAALQTSMFTLSSAFPFSGLPGRFRKPCFSC